MEDRGYLADVWRFFKPVALIDLGVFALVWLLMLLAGWSIQEYVSALQWGGVIILVAGALALTGGSNISRNAASPFLRSKEVEALHKHKGGRGGILAAGGDVRRLLHVIFAGVIPIVIGFLIQSIFVA